MGNDSNTDFSPNVTVIIRKIHPEAKLVSRLATKSQCSTASCDVNQHINAAFLKSAFSCKG